MRVVLVGTPAARDRLRATLVQSGLEIVGEATSVSDAYAAGYTREALLVLPHASSTSLATSRLGRSDPEADTTPLALEALTPRELDVLRWLSLGLPNKAIAEKLGISDQTVKFHVAAIIGKLNAVNRTDAVRRAVRRGLIDL
jgi:DNA-binding NarL/FixJ family response regulator